MTNLGRLSQRIRKRIHIAIVPGTNATAGTETRTERGRAVSELRQRPAQTDAKGRRLVGKGTARLPLREYALGNKTIYSTERGGQHGRATH